MKHFDSIIFDLDGTLWNACSASADGWTSGLMRLGYNKLITQEDIESICGLTYDEIMEKLFSDLDVDKEELKMTLNRYEELAVNKTGGKLFEGVSQYIPALSKSFKLYIVSNCQDWYLNSFLEHSQLGGYFLDWESHGRTKKPKSENILDIVHRNSLNNPVYIGDTPGDFNAAKEAGVTFHYAKYGYQSFDCEPFSNSFSELANFFLEL